MIKRTILLIQIVFLSSCSHRTIVTKAHPNNFKVQFHFDTHTSSIQLKSRWGSERNAYLFQFDNHSPTWVNNKVINATKSLSKADNISFRTSTADGKSIKGDVFLCDTVFIENVAFSNVLAYNINDTSRRTNGVIGENIISLGAWMFDFDEGIATFASSIDSLEIVSMYNRMLPSTFADNIFFIEPTFANGLKKKFAVDFGFSGSAALPLKDFDEISSTFKHSFPARFTTPAGEQIVDNKLSHETVALGTDSVQMTWYSNDKMTESVVGFAFFRQFQYVILDYPNQKIFVSVWRR